jgi:hypothetical protein
MADRAGVMRRRANFFNGTKVAVLPSIDDASLRLVSDTPASGTIAEREKAELVERHLAAFEATLPQGALSSGDKEQIRARAMLGSSSPSAIFASVMQAVGVVKPALSQAAINYHSSAAGPDAKTLDGLSGAGYRAGDPAFMRAIYGRDPSRERAGDGGLGGLTRVGSSSFGVGSDGSLSGMSTQFYRQNFQSHYGASPQGQFTATRVAGILGKNEGLSGEALVARTKEVATDTRQRLGLDTNIYAPKVANIGKKYSDPIIANKANRDDARAAQQRGDAAAQERHERTWLDQRKALEDRARREDPSKLGDVAGVNNGLLVEAVRNGYVFTQKNAAEFWNSITKSGDPQAAQRLKEVEAAASKSAAGRAMLARDRALIDQVSATTAVRANQEANAVTAEAARTESRAVAKAEVAAEADVFDTPTTPVKTDPKKAEAPTQDNPTQKPDATEQSAAPQGGNNKTQAAAAAPEKVDEKVQVAAAPAKKASGLVV